MMVTISLAALLLIGISATRGEKEDNGSTSEPSSKPADDPKAQVTSILQHRCARCHRNVNRLMANVVPGSAETSRLYRQAADGHKRKGPKRVCTADELKVIADWINSLTASSEPASQPTSKSANEPSK
jgi:hypothetical protein